MKKLIVMMLAGMMVLSLAACGKPAETPDSVDKPSGNLTEDADTVEEVEDNTEEELQVNPVELAFFPKTSPDAPAYATIKVSSDVKMDDESAWLGLCPEGKDYITEIEADEVDIIWFSMDYKEDFENDPTVFACDFETVEDGTYALVVATSDDENVGYVVIQLSMTKKGEEIVFDYSNAKLNDRPAK